MGIAGSILTMLLMLSVLTIVHEFGHYIAARICKVKVEEFAVFMGPKIISRVSKKTGTRWSLRSIPIGGFCAMEGEEETISSNTSFNNKPRYMRAFILVAGPLMNLLLAIILVVIMFAYTGYTTNVISEVTKIDEITEKTTPAYELGFDVGDKIVSYDGKKVITPLDYDVFNVVDKDLVSVIGIKKANGKVEEYRIEREKIENGKSNIGIKMTYEKGNFFKVIWNSILNLVSMVRTIFYSIFWLITGQMGMEAMSGPVGLTTLVNDVVTAEIEWVPKLLTLVNMSALISVNLGIFNLLPLPALDGGRLFLVFVEFLRRGKRIPPEKEATISFIGLALLVLLAIFVMGSDILKIVRG